jgi:hypothetical protein
MEGTVLHFDESTKSGVVRSDNGDRFDFIDSDWKSNGDPRLGVKVDFVAKDNVASEIYAVSSSRISENITKKLSDFQGSGLGQKITALFSYGMHNKFGLLATIAVLVSLFFPVIEIPFLGKGSLINDSTGKLLFIFLILLAIFFYGGATRLYTRILGGAIIGILFFQYYGLFTGLNQVNDFVGLFGEKNMNTPNVFSLIRWGAFVNIAASVVLFLATFIKEYTNNEKAI